MQSDNGSEFLGDFGPAVRKLQLTHYFNRPNYPQGNGRIERVFRTDEDEFLQVYDLPKTLPQLEEALLAWNHTYETVRPHQALGYKTPHQFYLDLARSTTLSQKGAPVRHVLTQHKPCRLPDLCGIMAGAKPAGRRSSGSLLRPDGVANAGQRLSSRPWQREGLRAKPLRRIQSP